MNIFSNFRKFLSNEKNCGVVLSKSIATSWMHMLSEVESSKIKSDPWFINYGEGRNLSSNIKAANFLDFSALPSQAMPYLLRSACSSIFDFRIKNPDEVLHPRSAIDSEILLSDGTVIECCLYPDEGYDDHCSLLFHHHQNGAGAAIRLEIIDFLESKEKEILGKDDSLQDRQSSR